MTARARSLARLAGHRPILPGHATETKPHVIEGFYISPSEDLSNVGHEAHAVPCLCEGAKHYTSPATHIYRHIYMAVSILVFLEKLLEESHHGKLS